MKGKWSGLLDWALVIMLSVVVAVPYWIMFVQHRQINSLENCLAKTREELGTIWLIMSSDKKE